MATRKRTYRASPEHDCHSVGNCPGGSYGAGTPLPECRESGGQEKDITGGVGACAGERPMPLAAARLETKVRELKEEQRSATEELERARGNEGSDGSDGSNDSDDSDDSGDGDGDGKERAREKAKTRHKKKSGGRWVNGGGDGELPLRRSSRGSGSAGGSSRERGQQSNEAQGRRIRRSVKKLRDCVSCETATTDFSFRKPQARLRLVGGEGKGVGWVQTRSHRALHLKEGEPNQGRAIRREVARVATFATHRSHNARGNLWILLFEQILVNAQ